MYEEAMLPSAHLRIDLPVWLKSFDIKRVGLGPRGQPVQRAIELLRATITHELHDAFGGAALHAW